MKKYELKEMKVADILFDSDNPNKMSETQLKALRTSLKKFGQLKPPIVDQTNTVCDGEHQVRVYKEEGYETIPVVQVQCTKSERRIIRQTMNKLHGTHDSVKDWAEYRALHQQGELSDLFKMLATPDKEMFNILQKLENEDHTLLSKEDGFDVVKALEREPKYEVKKGDVFLLGKNRVMCGDSTSDEDVSKLMNGSQADLAIIDPPYNVDYTGKTKDALKIDNDKKDNTEFYEFLLQAYKCIFKCLKDGAGLYVFHADSEGLNFRKAYQESGFLLKQCCIWVKNSMVMGRQDFHWQHEPILYGWKPGTHNWYADRKQTTVWNFRRPTRSKDHPTMKPVDLITYPLLCSSKNEDLVIDTFGGSGSTLISCQKNNRTCYTMELDPKYVSVILERWEYLTGGQPVKL